MRKLKNYELNRISINEFKQADKMPVVVVLDNIRSLHNIGSVFRTSDAFLVESVYLCGITASPPHKEIHKTALGATDSVDWQYFNNAIDALKLLRQQGYTIVSIEQTEDSIFLNDFSMEKDKKYAVIFGNEVKGVQQELVDFSDACIEIPQYGTKHSLNISVSAGLVLWDLFCKYRFAK